MDSPLHARISVHMCAEARGDEYQVNCTMYDHRHAGMDKSNVFHIVSYNIDMVRGSLGKTWPQRSQDQRYLQTLKQVLTIGNKRQMRLTQI